MSSPTFDRRVPPELADALEAEGPIHELVGLAQSELGWANGLDLRLRAQPGGANARATLYLGLTQVLHVRYLGRQRFKLQGQTGKGFAAKLDPALFDPSWAAPQPLDRLAAVWPSVMTYVRAAIEAAPRRYLSAEGLVQARLARGGEGFVTIDREVVINFPSQSIKDAALAREAVGVHAACERLAPTYRWAVKEKAFGDELDMLAVDQQGRVLVVEVKHGGDTAGVGWTPAQVARYLRLCQVWIEATPQAASILNGMLEQARYIGLITDSTFTVSDPVTLVPVIAIGEPMKNSAVANERMKIVHEALAEQDVELPELEVWSVDVEGRAESRGLGGL
jgi:hypothetical protein